MNCQGHAFRPAGVAWRRALLVPFVLSLVAVIPPGPPEALASDAAGAGSPNVRGRLHVEGRTIVYADGARFPWVGITAFRLLEQVAGGRASEADAFMRWARERGFTLVRVLAMADGLFHLPPDAGRAALPRLLEMAAEHDLYVEVVALADTRAYRMDGDGLRAQVAAVARVAASYPNALVEIANEPAHPTQADALHDARFVSGLASAVPGGVLFTDGSPLADDAPVPQGQYVVRHMDRGGAPWTMANGVARLAALEARLGRPVVSDEPIGAAERDEPGRRLSDPGVYFALAAIGRLLGVDTTFHCEDCLQARVPGRRQQACAAAFIEGATLLPPDVVPTSFEGRAPGSPVSGVSPADGVVGVYTGVAGDRAWTIAIGVRGDVGLTWAPPWHRVRVAFEARGVRAWEIARTGSGARASAQGGADRRRDRPGIGYRWSRAPCQRIRTSSSSAPVSAG